MNAWTPVNVLTQRRVMESGIFNCFDLYFNLSHESERCEVHLFQDLHPIRTLFCEPKRALVDIGISEAANLNMGFTNAMIYVKGSNAEESHGVVQLHLNCSAVKLYLVVTEGTISIR